MPSSHVSSTRCVGEASVPVGAAGCSKVAGKGPVRLDLSGLKAEEWQWDYAGQRWSVREETADELAECRALLLALTGTSRVEEVSKFAVTDPEVRSTLNKVGLLLSPDGAWVGSDQKPIRTELDSVEDIDVKSDSLNWNRVKAFAIGADLAAKFRRAQVNHQSSMKQWSVRPDVPEDEGDVFCQLLNCAEQQVCLIVGGGEESECNK